MPELLAFVLPEKPLSYNAFRSAERKANYATRLRNSSRDFGGLPPGTSPPYYGLVYHFHWREDRTDVDNVSKPVWDALRGLAYEDDAVVRLRIAGKLQIAGGMLGDLDLTRAPAAAVRRLTGLTGKQKHEHVLYVELGTLRDSMFVFGLGA